MPESINARKGILPSMGIILIRYGELALKSRPVRLRFERALMRNIEELFLRERAECIISREWGRILAHVGDEKQAARILSRVFGITSFSPALECGSGMEQVANATAERSRDVLRRGQSFAIRARRTGSHNYTSQQLAAVVGAAVLEANRGKDIRVDLSDPDAELFVEVRQNRAFIFLEKLPGPGGLPAGTQGRVVALLDGENGAAAAWMMMKRGCRIIAVAGEPASRGTGGPVGGAAGAALEMLRPWAPGLNLHTIGDASLDGLAGFARRRRAEAIVLGRTYDELERTIPVAGMPVLLPLCALSEEEMSSLVTKIKGSAAPAR